MPKTELPLANATGPEATKPVAPAQMACRKRSSGYFNLGDPGRLPAPILGALDDAISNEQLSRLNYHPVEYLNLATNGAPGRVDQVASLQCPRTCIDTDNNIVDRFVTDNEISSGRVYDRLYGREVLRLIPYINEVSRQVYDVWEDRIRFRILMDDLRDANAKDGLEVTEGERDCKYCAAPDHIF